MLIHGVAPRDLMLSSILHIPKNKLASVSSSENYQGIALSSILGKIMDHVLLYKYCDKLCTSEQQFGFKHQSSSTNMCTLVLKETLSYHVNNRSNVFCSFLDVSKAFDKVHYCKLFRILIEHRVPPGVIRILMNLYKGHAVRVMWNGVYSGFFTGLNGVKQGGVISPVLFCLYIDNLLIQLAQSAVGCHIGNTFVGALAYADDIVMVAPTPSAL